MAAPARRRARRGCPAAVATWSQSFQWHDETHAPAQGVSADRKGLEQRYVRPLQIPLLASNPAKVYTGPQLRHSLEPDRVLGNRSLEQPSRGSQTTAGKMHLGQRGQRISHERRIPDLGENGQCLLG
ncbi:MAG TPA: hypothetical protein VIR57_12130 [Chloroflexota bacterium]